MFLLQNYRYMSKVCLIPFIKETTEMTPAERFQADRVLSEAMNIACYVAPIMIQLKTLLNDTDEFQRIINKISQLKCISNDSPQCLHVSYSRLLFATVKVCCSSFCNVF